MNDAQALPRTMPSRQPELPRTCSVADVGEVRLCVLLRWPASPFAISKAPTDKWLTTETRPLGSSPAEYGPLFMGPLPRCLRADHPELSTVAAVGLGAGYDGTLGAGS